jgi:molecular chaperone GrpE
VTESSQGTTTDESVEVTDPSEETSTGSFGDAAAEMANETEVEATTEREPEAEEADAPSVEQQLAERTADLQRLQAEYVNYKRRVERDRDLVRENATYQALVPIIEVLDNIDRAREHGPLDAGFRGVAEQLERVVAAQGLTRFGEPGDPFDPTIHEALSHIGQDPDVDVITCKVIAKAGYRMGDRVVRAAQVLVVDPGERDEPPATEM